MRDPLTWSMSLGRLFGINVRVHLLFPLIAIGLILRAAYKKDPAPPDGTWIDLAMIMGLLFFSVLLHELGHCVGARWVGGDAQEVLMWPLGGLAWVEVPNTARANFIATAAGPAVNFLLAALALILLQAVGPEPLQPWWGPFEYHARGFDGLLGLRTWHGEAVNVSPYSAAALLSWLFWVNWFGLLINVLLIGFPLDGGRMFQCILWPYVGYRQATFAAVMAGFVTVFVVGLYGIVVNEVLALGLAAFIYFACKHQLIILETGGEESLFGYDFSQGYTSLERDAPPPPAPPKPKLSWWQRWQQRRAAKRMQREQEAREADERRMDQLLEKISAQGIASLTDEERRFMKQFSERYKKH
jgi:Zn-dependent protease